MQEEAPLDNLCSSRGRTYMATETIAPQIDPEILEFIKTNKVASICCSTENKPYCFSCFYSFLEAEQSIIFKSMLDTRHIAIATENNAVAGTVISQEISMTKVTGIQFEGILIENDNVGGKASRCYYLRYPFAMAVPGKLWVVELHSIKYTNTINGVKHKKEWNAEGLLAH